MNRRVVVVGLVLALVLLVGLIGLAKQGVFVGEGTQISPFYDSGIFADEPCWVRHGWRGDYYPGFQPEIKADYGNQKFVAAGLMTFQLFIDGKEVKLRFKRDVFPGDEPGTTTHVWSFYIQFEPYHFEPGIYVLGGVYDAKNPNSVEKNTIPLPWTTRTSILTVKPLEP